ncbi:MAG TPA: aminoglycoside phosphotransferase family protein, partial [Sphingobacteriaceae bacterium]
FHIRNSHPGHPDYLLQRINHQVFRNVDVLMDNIVRVTAHLKQKAADPAREVLTVVDTLEGGSYCRDADGNYWRMFVFIDHTHSYEQITDLRQAFQGGKAFGRFQQQLTDLRTDSLGCIIPDFHNLEKRVVDFESTLEADPCGRRSGAAGDIRFLLDQKDAMLQRSREVESCPVRITHNDTKFNNLLLDGDDRVQCVVDLDTVMPGFLAYDFGDAMRTLINTAAEDEPDVSKIQLNIAVFQAYTRGYLEEARSFITGPESESLVAGMLVLPYMQSIRFLTDYLLGDPYYKILYPDHNLVRTRAQSALLARIASRTNDLRIFIEEAAVGIDGDAEYSQNG